MLSSVGVMLSGECVMLSSVEASAEGFLDFARNDRG